MAENQLVALNDSDELDFGYSKAFFVFTRHYIFESIKNLVNLKCEN
jgi:hypothetical protein